MITVIGAWRLPGGAAAAFLLALDPVIWYSGVASPVRVYLAAGVCWLLWSFFELAGGRASFLWVSALLLSLFAGFRLELGPLFAAPFVIAARLGGVGWRRIALAAALSIAACLPWIWWIASTFGSFYRMVYVCYYYFLHHASTTTAFLGAPAVAWQGLLRNCVSWNALPATVALLAMWMGRSQIGRRFLLPAGVYFVPALIIQLALHLGPNAPDHALGTITILWLVAAARASWRAVLAAPVLLAISLAPPGTLPPQFDLLSLRSFTRGQAVIAAMVQTLRSALRPGDTVLALNDSPLPGRIIESEFPSVVVLALDSTIEPNSTAPPTGWRFFNRSQTSLPAGGIPIDSLDRLHVVSIPASTQRRLVEGAINKSTNQQVSIPPYSLRLTSR